MYKYKNIAITGAKQVGKSTLADWFISAAGLPFSGFRTVKYDTTDAGPLYAINDICSGRQLPISEYRCGAIRGIPDTFDGFGTELLLEALNHPAPILLLDEIGRFERTSKPFLQAVFQAFDSEKMVIAVLKKEELPYIQQIKARKDTFLIDLDQIAREEARAILSRFL